MLNSRVNPLTRTLVSVSLLFCGSYNSVVGYCASLDSTPQSACQCCHKSCCSSKSCGCCNNSTNSQNTFSKVCTCQQDNFPADLPKQTELRNLIRLSLIVSQIDCALTLSNLDKKSFSSYRKLDFCQIYSVPLTISKCVWLT